MLTKPMLLERLAHYQQQKDAHQANMQASAGAVQAIEELLGTFEALERQAATAPQTGTASEIVKTAIEKLARLEKPGTPNAVTSRLNSDVQEADA